MTQTVDGLFSAALERFPERRFLRYFDGGHIREVTYAQATPRVAATIDALHARGVKSGDRVICFLDQALPSIYFTLACSHAGVVMVPISPRFSLDALSALMKRVDAKLVLTTSDQADRLREGGISLLYYGDDATPEALPLAPPISEAQARATLKAAQTDHGPDSVYLLLPTSGTTGEPKLVIRTHLTYVLHGPLVSYGLSADNDPPIRVLVVTALTHALGHLNFSAGLTLCGEFCVPSEMDTAASLDEVRALDPQYMLVVPRILRAWHQTYEADPKEQGRPMFGPSADILRVGGAPADPPIMKVVQAQGVDVGEVLGGSESGLLAVTQRGGWRELHAGTILHDAEVKLAPDGEILVRSARGMVGYYGDEALTKEAFAEGRFYRTGDFGEITPDNYLRVLGRKRDVFNTHEGSNIYPARIEQMLEGLPWVRQVVLIGDQRPFISALVVVNDSVAPSDQADGYLAEPGFTALYDRARADLEELNTKLEGIEKVRRVALFHKDLDPALYTLVTAGKTRRDRKGIAAAYAARITALYATPLS